MFPLEYSICDEKSLLKKSQNYAVAYTKNSALHFGIIRKFYKLNHNIYSLIQKLEKADTFVTNPNLEEIASEFFAICVISNYYDLVQIEHISCKCVIINKDSKVFISKCNNLQETK